METTGVRTRLNLTMANGDYLECMVRVRRSRAPKAVCGRWISPIASKVSKASVNKARPPSKIKGLLSSLTTGGCLQRRGR